MEAVLEAVSRDTFGKNEAGRTRRQGRVPAVVYGSAGNSGAAGNAVAEALPVAVDPKALLRILHSESGANTLISLKLPGKGDAKVLVKEYQLDPVTHEVLHADFYRIAMDVAIRVTVPIHVVGEAPGVKTEGGILELILREIEVECLPGDIPERIDLDVSNLGINGSLRVSDVAAPAKVKVLEAADQVVVHVVSIKEEVVAAPGAVAPVEGEAAAAPAEPEVMKKGKKEEEPPAE